MFYLIPFEYGNPTRHTAWTVYTLICINLIVFAITLSSQNDTSFYRAWGFIPAEPHFATLVTSMFVHAGIGHFIGNMFFLWIFGDNIEDVIGIYAFIVVYLVCGFAADGLHYFLNPESTVPLVGASGAIAGIAGLYFVFFPHARIDLKLYFYIWHITTFTTTSFVLIGVWLIWQAALGVVTEMADTGMGVAFWAHVGGVVSGIIFGIILRTLGYLRNYKSGGKRNALVGYIGME